MMKTITQNHIINADPEDVFAAITNPFSIELWSGLKADFKPEEGYEFSIFDGDINGINITIVLNEMIKQEFFMGENFENSIVTISLKEHKGKTEATVLHENIPDHMFSEIKEWWKHSYWTPVKDFF